MSSFVIISTVPKGSHTQNRNSIEQIDLFKKGGGGERYDDDEQYVPFIIYIYIYILQCIYSTATNKQTNKH